MTNDRMTLMELVEKSANEDLVRDMLAYLAATLEAIANGHPAARVDDLMPWAFSQPSS